MLSGCLTLVYLALDFYRFVRRCYVLDRIANQTALTLDNLPQPENLLEDRYQELLTILLQEKEQALAQFRQSQQELEEYYTMWVHQVKTPIAATRLLLQTGAGGEQTRELELELFKIERYVDMVLQYLRVESPSADLVIRRHNLDDIVRQAVRRYARLFVQKRIPLEYKDLRFKPLTLDIMQQ